MPVPRSVRLTCWFAACLFPVVVGELSVNYLFVAGTIVFALSRGVVLRPPQIIGLAIALYTAVFATAWFYQIDFLPFAARRLLSYCIFMTVFTVAFSPVDDLMVVAFKRALVLISVSLSVWAAIGLLKAPQVDLEQAKNLVGSQSLGYIYLMAFWILLLAPAASSRRALVARYAALGVIVVGLLLTFSRASVVALVVPLAAFLVRRQLLWLRRPTRTGLRRFALGVVGAVVVVVLVQKFFPITLGFFQQRLVDVVANPETVRAQLANPDMSPGIRVQIWRHILDFVSANPLTGAGFLGVWIIPSAKTGSAHNQYFDVLFRSGLPGFGMYLVLLFLLLRYLRRADQALFWGLVAVLIYGVFHETFKESQGAFVLAFLLGMFSESVRRRRRPESPIKTAALAAA